MVDSMAFRKFGRDMLVFEMRALTLALIQIACSGGIIDSDAMVPRNANSHEILLERRSFVSSF